MKKNSITLSQACDGVIRYKSAVGMSSHTIRDYRNSFIKLQAYFPDDPQFQAITRDQLVGFFTWLATRGSRRRTVLECAREHRRWTTGDHDGDLRKAWKRAGPSSRAAIWSCDLADGGGTAGQSSVMGFNPFMERDTINNNLWS